MTVPHPYPYDPADIMEEQCRRDERDLAWLRQRVRRDCSDAEMEAALRELGAPRASL